MALELEVPSCSLLALAFRRRRGHNKLRGGGVRLRPRFQRGHANDSCGTDAQEVGDGHWNANHTEQRG